MNEPLSRGEVSSLATLLVRQLSGAEVTDEQMQAAAELLPEPEPDEDRAEREAERQRKWAAERRTTERARRVDASGIRLARAAREAVISGDLQRTAARDRVTNWLRSSDEGSVLLLVGGTGVGKTVAAAEALMEHGGHCLSSEKLSRLAGSNYGADVDMFDESIALECLLVVDDIGTERDADKARHMLFQLVDTRQGIKGRTLMTSNLTVEQLKERLCERTLSRLHGVGAIYGCKGGDLRRVK